MKITLTNTEKIVTLKLPSGEVPARIWEGRTERGVPVHAFITRVAVAKDQDAGEFERELQECPPARPSEDMEAIPLRLIIG